MFKYFVLAEDEVMDGNGRVFFTPSRERGVILEALAVERFEVNLIVAVPGTNELNGHEEGLLD